MEPIAFEYMPVLILHEVSGIGPLLEDYIEWWEELGAGRL